MKERHSKLLGRNTSEAQVMRANCLLEACTITLVKRMQQSKSKCFDRKMLSGTTERTRIQYLRIIDEIPKGSITLRIQNFVSLDKKETWF